MVAGSVYPREPLFIAVPTQILRIYSTWAGPLSLSSLFPSYTRILYYYYYYAISNYSSLPALSIHTLTNNQIKTTLTQPRDPPPLSLSLLSLSPSYSYKYRMKLLVSFILVPRHSHSLPP